MTIFQYAFYYYRSIKYAKLMRSAHSLSKSINFMAKHARGLICLAMSEKKCAALNLNQMVSDNKSGHGTGFTVSTILFVRMNNNY